MTDAGIIPTPPITEGTVTVPSSNWTLFRSLPSFNIRNGDVSSVSSVFIRATIATPYHWVPIDNLSCVDAKGAVDGFVRSEIAHLAAHPPVGLSATQIRKVAICLGVIRAVSTTFYRLDNNDLIAGERANPYLAAVKEDNGDIKFTVVPDANRAENVAAALTGELTFDDTEVAAICAIIKCATGIVAMQGYSIMMTNHHYLSQADTQSRKVFAVVERAYWNSQDVADWFSSDAQVIQDAMWHKSCHPVHMQLKTAAAMDPLVATMITNSGSGACASRLPALETELRSANSYITLMATVNPMFAICNGGVNFDDLVTVTEIVKAFPAGVMNPPEFGNLPEGMKGIVTNRTTAITYLSGMLKRNQDIVAYCYGFYVALSESSMMMGAGTSGQGDTLKSSFSLSKLKNQSFASYTAGYQAYGDYQAVRNARRQKGEFDAPKFVLT